MAPYTFAQLPGHDTVVRHSVGAVFASCECGAEGPDGTLDSACDWIAAHCLSLLCDLDEAGLRVAARLAPDFTGTLDELISTARAIAA